jgi:hypothetical protein
LILAILAVIGKEAIQSADDPELRISLNTVVEAIRCNDPVSGDALNGVEQQIQERFEELKNVVASGDKAEATELCSAINRLFAERNVKCKSLK